MTHLDLFSGIGGFALAARWAGFETVQFVENEPFCQQVLAKNFKGVPIHGDIKTFKANGIVPPFLLTGGYPCQPFSQAGKRRGTKDDRHLWPEMFRIIQECRPTWVLAENVSGHIKLGLQEVLTDLESEGYDSQVFHIGAVAQDAPHRRMRIWIVSHSTSGLSHRKGEEICTGRNSTTISSEDVAHSSSIRCPEGSDFRGEIPEETGGTKSDFRSSTSSEDVADSSIFRSKTGIPGSQQGEEGFTGIINNSCSETGGGERCSTGVTGPGLGGTLSDGLSLWMDEPDIPRVGVKIPDRAKRLKAIGNAIVPQVAYEIIRHMKEVT